MKPMMVVYSLLLSLLPLSYSLARPQVDITSFYYVQSGSRLAELCGRTIDINKPALLSIVVDENTNRPATYTTTTDSDGKFCLLVWTYQGTVAVSLDPYGLSTKLKATWSQPSTR